MKLTMAHAGIFAGYISIDIKSSAHDDYKNEMGRESSSAAFLNGDLQYLDVSSYSRER